MMLNQDVRRRREWSRQSRYPSIGALIVLCCLAPAFGGIVLPPGNATVAGNGSAPNILGATPFTAHYVYGKSLLGALPVGSVLTGISFRLNSGASTGPSADQSYGDWSLSLSPSLNPPGSLSATFSNNTGPGAVVVRNGPLTLSANSMTGGTTVNSFGPVIRFTTPYTYTGGDLLLTLTHTAGSGSGVEVDFQGAPTLQYQIAFSYQASTGTLQDSGAPVIQLEATCKTAPTSVTALNVERAVPLANVLTTITPNANPATLAALAGGALEIREQLIYNPGTSQVTSTVFYVPTGSPLPSPFGTVSAANLITVTTMSLTQILTSCSPLPSLLFVGSVSGSTPSSQGFLFGPLVGASSALSVGYTTDKPAAINNVTETIAGIVTLYSAAATGTLTVPTTTTPGGGGGTGPTIVVKTANGTIALPNTNQQAPGSPFFLDASGSSSSGGALTFTWSTISGSPVAFVGTGVAGQILVQFPGPGDYNIQLKVTDAAGNSATFTLTLTYTGRPQ